MLLSKVCRVLYAFLIFLGAVTFAPNCVNALQINTLNQNAKTIINCNREGFLNLGNSDCAPNLQIDNHQERNLTVTNLAKAEDSILRTEKQIPASIPESNPLSGLLLGASVTSMGFLTFNWVVKKLFPSKPSDGLKERIEVLETIVTKD